jgi:hypothetical protein
MVDLEGDGFEEIPRPHTPWGIYALVLRGEVVYIGMSKSIYQRIAQHRAASLRNRGVLGSDRVRRTMIEKDPLGGRIQFDEVWVRWCRLPELERLELYYIDRFKPRWNLQIREPLPEVPIDIRQLAERMGWKLGQNRAHENLLRGRTL